jgi:hypothetical protein
MDDISTITYLRTQAEFYKRDVLQSFLEGLAVRGHYVAGSDWIEVRQVWKTILNGESLQAVQGTVSAESLFVPGVSSVLWNDVEEFVEQRSPSLAIYLFSTAYEGELRAFEATFDLEPEEYRISSSMHGNPDILAQFLHWLNILQYTYETWHPLYSYDEGYATDTTFEDALAGNITRLYQINLLNSDMVEKLGKGRVMATPAWRLTTLGDGSVFLIPKLIYNGGQDEDYRYNRAEAAAHLGLDTD